MANSPELPPRDKPEERKPTMSTRNKDFDLPPNTFAPPANPGEPDIEKLLGYLEDETRDLMSQVRRGDKVLDWSGWEAPRASLVGYVEELRKERDRLRDIYSVCPNCDVSWTGGEVEQWYKTMEAEISRLQANQLSPEEARQILFAIGPKNAVTLEHFDDPLFAKLRSLRGNEP